MRVRIATKVQEGYMYSTIYVYQLSTVYDALYEIGSPVEVQKMLRFGELYIGRNDLSPALIEPSWESLSTDNAVIFYDPNINHLYYSPWSLYFNGKLSTQKISTKSADLYNYQVQLALCA